MEKKLCTLNNLCRVCLSITDVMSDLFDSSKKLCYLFQTVVHIELEKDDTLPNFLCSSCEEKILICEDFIDQCKKTNELLAEYKKNDIETKEEKTKAILESNHAEYIAYDDNSNDFEDFSKDIGETTVTTPSGEIVKSPNHFEENINHNESKNSRRLPVKQFPYEEVMGAIEEIKEEETKAILESNHAEYIKYDDNSNDFEDFSKDIGETTVTTPSGEIVKSPNHFEENINHNESKNSRRLPVKQFPYEEVMGAIEVIKNKSNNVRDCIKCNYHARNFRSLSLHMSYMHKETKGKWCSICNALFEKLEEHSKVHKKRENYCQFCERGFAQKRFLIEHLLTHSITRPHKCDICSKSFIHAKNLRKHNISHLEEKPFACNFCGTTFTQRCSLKTHSERFHKDEKEFRCIHCKCKFETEETLRTHECAQNSSNAFLRKQNYCSICNKNVRSLTLHNKKIHEGRIVKESPAMHLCTVCGKQIKNYDKFQEHMRAHNGETPFSCRYCDKKMTRRCLLVTHERTHTGERPYICCICKKDFTQRSSLNTHMKIHSDIKEACFVCGKEFYRTADLKLHLQKHTGEKPFICIVCDKAFSQKYHLAVHVRMHTDNRPFDCDYCHKSFRQRSTLKTHVQMHLGEKPFKCSQCSYACRQSSRLTNHMLKHSSDAPVFGRPYSCEHCHRNFKTLAVLNSHISNAHINVSL